MSNPSPTDSLAIAQEEIDRLTAGLLPEEIAALGLQPEDDAAALPSPAPEEPQPAGSDSSAQRVGATNQDLSLEELDQEDSLFNDDLSAATPDDPSAVRSGEVRPVQFPSLGASNSSTPSNTIDLLLDVELKLTAELGQTRLTIREILDLGTGSIVELNRLAGEPVDVTVNNMLIAKGEVVVVDDKFGIRILNVVSPAKRISSLL